jgi:hypothetical protein
MERLDLRELVNVFGTAPFGEAARRIHIGPSRMGVVDLCREKFENASRGFSCQGEQRPRPEVCEGAIISSFMLSPPGFIRV